MYRKNWKIFFCMAVLIACFSSSAQSAARKASQYSTDDATKTNDAADKATGAADKAAGAVDGATGAADKAAGAVDGVTGAVDGVTGAVDGAAGAVDGAAGAVDGAAGAVDGATGAVDGATDAVDGATDAADGATDAVDGATGAVDGAAGAADGATDAADGATDAADKATDAMNKAIDSEVEKASVADPASLSFQGMIHSREFILENQKALFKDYDLDTLLQSIQMVLEKNDIKDVQKQFHQLFDKENSFVYSCSAENAALDENWQAAKERMVQEYDTQNNQKTVADVKSHDYESHLQEAQERLEKMHEKSNHAESSQGKDDPLLSPKALYKKGYDLILSAKYAEAEKAFCAFQHRYQKDPLNDEVSFLLAESLLGQKRYHEAAQVYLTAWYADKKKLYTSEVLLKLARSMVALDQNKEVCADLAKKSTYHNNTLGAVFCKSLNL
ncbi:TolA-binding protein [Bartonella japonica]|uniref:TolA-binding protein n=1 Tax=Bartonella japonica TaxID=357761 RepID=A0ABV2FQ41_9HYPH